MLTTGDTCAAPGDGAEPGKQLGKWLKRSATEIGSERPGGKKEPRSNVLSGQKHLRNQEMWWTGR